MIDAPRGRRLVALLGLTACYVLIALAIVRFDATYRPDSSRASDDLRYRAFAENIVNGFYTWQERPDLTNGPGYPLVLAPIAALDIGWWPATVLNIAFVVLAVMYCHATLRLYVAPGAAALGATYLAAYPPLVSFLPYQMTEPLVVFLVAGAAFHLVRTFGKAPNERFPVSHAVASVLFLAYLALTKVLFGYVLGAFLAIAGIAAVAFRRYRPARRATAILALALALCLPWLVYTYSITGKVFHWAGGGNAIYWMSSPYPEEFGDSHWPNVTANEPHLARHRAVLDQIRGKSRVEQSQILSEAAFRNIADHPVKYLKNVVANVSRILFNFPFSYKPQTPNTLLYLVPNLLLLWPLLIAIVALVLAAARRACPADRVAILTLFVIAFAISSAVAAAARQFTVLVPLALILVAQAAGLSTFARIARWLDPRAAVLPKST